ncbi:MAG: TfoX/Sxy family DNA transformation protein [Anaeromassilibacillus sp.]
MPNTGTAIESQLEPVGISTPEALRSVGSQGSWQRPYSSHRFIRLLQPPLCAERHSARYSRLA